MLNISGKLVSSQVAQAWDVIHKTLHERFRNFSRFRKLLENSHLNFSILDHFQAINEIELNSHTKS